MFAGNGALQDAQDATLLLEFGGGALWQQVAVSFGQDIINDAAQGLGGSTSVAAPTSIYSIDQHGFTQGTGLAVHVNAYGRVTVELDSGAGVDIGSVALARFPNEAELAAVEDASMRSTNQSGDAQYSLPGSAGRGLLD